MSIFKSFILFSLSFILWAYNGYGQANPTMNVLPANSGLVSLGDTLDLQITIGNTGSASIPAFKLRPVITVPNLIVTLLLNPSQSGLPPGWSIVTNDGTQIRICNGADVIPSNQSRTIFIKVRAIAIGGPSTFAGQIAFGSATTCANAGPSVTGNNPADDNATSTIQVVAGCSLGVVATVGTIACNGGITNITVTSTAALGPVEYSITGGAPFQNSNIFTVPVGTYTITAREINNPLTCVALTTITVTQPPAVLSPTVSVIQPTCTVSSGIVSITSSTIGLTFSVDGGPYTSYPTVGYLLAAGSHSVTAINGNNCTSPTVNFTINAQPPTSAAPVIGVITQANCTVSTGSVVLTNLPAGTWTVNPGNISGNSASTTVTNLAAGTYNFTVTNSSGCTSLPSASVTINAVVGAPAAPLINIIQPTCTVSTGSIIITSVTTNLTFSLDGGPYTVYPSGGYNGISSGAHTLIGQNISGCLSPFANIIINPQPLSPVSPTISITQPTCTVSTATINVTSNTTGLTFSFDGGAFTNYPVGGYVTVAGTHSLAVQNLSGCAPNITNNIIVDAQPATPAVNASSTLITCNGANSIITAIASGGISPYEYSINNGPFLTTNSFSVVAGSYIIAVKDFNGCIGSTSNILITQPSAITATASSTPILCTGGNSTLTITASGGVGAFEYSLNNAPYQTLNSFNVLAGTYTARVRLVANPACSTAANTVVNVVQPTTLKATSKADAIKFCGGSTIVEVKATGGKTPYTGTGNFTRGPGKWTFNVVDSNGCSSSTEVNILPPGCVELKVFPNPSDNIISINHSAAVNTGASFQIFSVNGARVITQRVAANTFLSNIDISRLASGNYLLVYIDGTEKKETKFIKINK